VKEPIYIIKIGGNIIDDEALLHDFLEKFAALPAQKILIHGGGKLATRLASQLNIPQQLIEGRRITDAETLKVVTMVYAGLVNKTVVATLQSFQCNAIGFSGADGDLIRSVKRGTEKLDYGFVGDVQKVNTEVLLTLIKSGFTPVIAPITHDGRGVLLNTNADTIAQEIATSLADHFNVNLIYSFEKKGVLLDVDNEDSVIPKLDPVLYEQYRKEGKIFAGMIPKLDNAFSAISAGVKKVIIGKAEELEILVSGKTGTILTNEEHTII
jgi:acetylglutamate kinase